VLTHRGGRVGVGPLTETEFGEWEANLAASAGYLIGITVRRSHARRGGRGRQARLFR
jgi:hypothetical protein